MKNYSQLEEIIAKIRRVNNIILLLHWDSAVNMRAGSVDNRVNEVATLTSIVRSMLTSPKTIELIEQVSEITDRLNAWQLANLQEIKREVSLVLCVDDSLQNRFIQTTTQCELVWRQAKIENDYTKLKPYLQSVLECVKEIAVSKSREFSCSMYDALIDKYDPGSKASEIRSIYNILKKKLPNLIQEIRDKQKYESVIPLAEVSIEQQRLISYRIIETLGFNLTKGRLDESAHPFCRGNSDDVRLTTKYDKHNLLLGVGASMHEAGHGLYEQGLPALYKYQFVGRARSMSLHESQALLMERHIGESKAFAEFFSKLLRDEFNLIGKQYSSSNLYKLVTRVNPSFIRMYADEVTYPMHVILRFEIEEALINNDLTLDELPSFWNQKMHQYLGITPPSHREGCMQDIHWTYGNLGYFPSYTNGAIIASMFMQAIKNTYPNINQEIVTGDLNNVNQFLDTNIRRFGSLKSSNSLIKDATGYNKIDPIVFLKYLEEKYLG